MSLPAYVRLSPLQGWVRRAIKAQYMTCIRCEEEAHNRLKIEFGDAVLRCHVFCDHADASDMYMLVEMENVRGKRAC